MMPKRPRLCPVSLILILFGAAAGQMVLPGCSARLAGKPVPSAGAVQGCPAAHLANLELRQLSAGAAGRGRVQFVADDSRGRASFDFVFRRPDSLRLQFRSPLGPAAAVLDLSGDHYLFADFRQGVFLRGHAAAVGFHRLTGLPVSPQTLVAVLLAEPLPDQDGVAEVRFQDETCLPHSCELRGRPTEPAVTVEYHWPAGATARGGDDDGLLLPDRVVFHGPEAGRKTTIRFKSVRPLSEAERRQAPDPIDTTGLHPAVQDDTGETVIPRWLR